MNVARWIRLVLSLTMLHAGLVAAEVPEQVPGFSPTGARHANWAFSGMVTNETGEHYGYFFQMKRDGDQFHAIAALVDGETKSLVLLEESDAIIHDAAPYNWHVGRTFLRFNPINDSWIFGLQANQKKGFNFKVDMPKQTENIPIAQDLREGVELLMSQTSNLNGHIQIGDGHKEQFVTSKNAWFRQVWLSNQQEKMFPYIGVLCRFNDGSGFYSVNMSESDALRGAVAGFKDGQGMPIMISQFINVTQEDAEGPWHIRIASPSLHYILADFIQQNSIVAAGFVHEDKTQGFCLVSKDTVGELA